MTPPPGAPRRPRIATAWLCGCSGCHMSLLDLDEALLDLAAQADLVYGPFVDAKAFPGEVDVALVEGAVSDAGHLALAREIRAKSRVVVALGDCAVHGNVPAMRNGLPVEALLRGLYGDRFLDPPRNGGCAPLPALLPAVLPLHRVVPVDAALPGCPPGREAIRAALAALLAGAPVALPEGMRRYG